MVLEYQYGVSVVEKRYHVELWANPKERILMQNLMFCPQAVPRGNLHIF